MLWQPVNILHWSQNITNTLLLNILLKRPPLPSLYYLYYHNMGVPSCVNLNTCLFFSFLFFSWKQCKIYKKIQTTITELYHNQALTRHIQKKLHFQYAHKSECCCARAHTHAQRHIFSVINLVYHNDLTKIVNTITYCERANHKTPRQLHIKKR